MPGSDAQAKTRQRRDFSMIFLSGLSAFLEVARSMKRWRWVVISNTWRPISCLGLPSYRTAFVAVPGVAVVAMNFIAISII